MLLTTESAIMRAMQSSPTSVYSEHGCGKGNFLEVMNMSMNVYMRRRR